jgi:hypothetical protein
LAPGNQVWTGHIGTFTANARKNAINSNTWGVMPIFVVCHVARSKVPVCVYRYSNATNISSEPISVYRKNLNAAYTRLGPPHTPMMMYIGISVASKNT